MTHKGTQALRSERLILRRFEMDDAEAMYQNWASDPLVTKYLCWYPHPNVDTTRGVLGSWLEKYDGARYYNWLIELNGTPIGAISVVHLDCEHDSAEIGYCIGRAYWGRGIAAEALATVLDYLFFEVGLHRISMRHDVQNPASGRVMQKNGLVYEGTLREDYHRKDGTWGDMRMYSALQAEWEERRRGGKE